MRIADFQNFIREIPYKNQAFDIKKEIWKFEGLQTFIDEIFKGNTTITINRDDLINSSWNTKEFIIKTLMWGYPTKGRGRNIENIFKLENFEKLVNTLEIYRENEISIDQLKKDIKSIPGLGLSTITKFTHFLNTTIDGKKAVILDIQIIKAINTGRFEDFNHLTGMTYDNAINRYPEYLETVNKLSKSINAEPDQIEMFLFTFGRVLSPIKYSFQDKMNSGGARFIVDRKIEPMAENSSNDVADQDLYRQRLIEAYKSLITIRENLFTSSLNIAMAGELKEIDEVFDEGDTFKFEIEHFKNTSDIILSKLIEFIEKLENLMNSIANINAIKETELK